MRRPFSNHQRFPLVVPHPPDEKRTRLRVLFAASACALAAASALVAAPLALRIGIVSAALSATALAFVGRKPKVRSSGSHLSADASGLSRVAPDGTKAIVEWAAPFGVTLLASYGRPHALLAFTTPTQTRYVPTRLESRSEIDDELFAKIAVLADLDLVDGVMHDAALTTESAAALVRLVEARAPEALGRLYLSDGRGTPIALDRATLAVGDRAFDLTSQLEWRALMFHESTGQAAALYQATWIRQAASEVVLVAPMPASIVPRERDAQREASGRLGRALTRDLRLLQSQAEPPPQRELRVAIDRPFMLAVRRALDSAPLASRVTVEAPAKKRAEERDSMA